MVWQQILQRYSSSDKLLQVVLFANWIHCIFYDYCSMSSNSWWRPRAPSDLQIADFDGLRARLRFLNPETQGYKTVA